MYFNIFVTTVQYLSNKFCLFIYLFSHSCFFFYGINISFCFFLLSPPTVTKLNHGCQIRDFSCAVSGLGSKMCRNTEDSRYTREKTSDTQGTLLCEQRLHFRGMSWRASSYRENVASARRVRVH